MKGARRCAGMTSAVILLLLTACAAEDAPPADARDLIELRWLKAYPKESRSDVETGLLWSLSLVGAGLPEKARVIRWRGERITVDMGQAQVLDGTLPAWRQLLAAMRDSGEYRAQGALDVGRFVAVILGDAELYYALTQANPDYQAARARYRFDERKAAIVRSSVAHGGRLIELPLAAKAEQLAFVAFEGRGSFADGSFAPHEIELVDMMPNGQLRFALYGLDGRLKRGATRELTSAGKPAKCMWCHESGLQPTFLDFAGARGYYGRREFDALIAQRRILLNQYRDGLDTRIEYDNAQDHTFAELLYLTFEEPSRQRLAAEWGVTAERAAELLRGKPTHAQAEFAWLGSELYRREDVDGLAPYAVLAAPRSVREESAEEPATAAVRP